MVTSESLIWGSRKFCVQKIHKIRPVPRAIWHRKSCADRITLMQPITSLLAWFATSSWWAEGRTLEGLEKRSATWSLQNKLQSRGATCRRAGQSSLLTSSISACSVSLGIGWDWTVLRKWSSTSGWETTTGKLFSIRQLMRPSSRLSRTILTRGRRMLTTTSKVMIPSWCERIRSFFRDLQFKSSLKAMNTIRTGAASWSPSPCHQGLSSKRRKTFSLSRIMHRIRAIELPWLIQHLLRPLKRHNQPIRYTMAKSFAIKRSL